MCLTLHHYTRFSKPLGFGARLRTRALEQLGSYRGRRWRAAAISTATEHNVCCCTNRDPLTKARRLALITDGAWRARPPPDINTPRNPEQEFPMHPLASRGLSRNWLVSAALLFALTTPTLAADALDAPKGASVTVLKAAKACFGDIVEVSGIVVPREETMVRPERPGLKVAEILADPGDTVTAGQTLARLRLPEGGRRGAGAGRRPDRGLHGGDRGRRLGKGEALFTIIARSEFDLVGLVPAAGHRQARGQARPPPSRWSAPATWRARCAGSRRRSNPTASSARSSSASCQQAPAGEFIRPRDDQDRPELRPVGAADRRALWHGRHRGPGDPPRPRRNRQVEIGLMSGGQVEIRNGLNEGDDVVARAGALLREGDPVRPVMAAARRGIRGCGFLDVSATAVSSLSPCGRGPG